MTSGQFNEFEVSKIWNIQNKSTFWHSMIMSLQNYTDLGVIRSLCYAVSNLIMHLCISRSVNISLQSHDLWAVQWILKSLKCGTFKTRVPAGMPWSCHYRCGLISDNQLITLLSHIKSCVFLDLCITFAQSCLVGSSNMYLKVNEM